jgi:hypothetical protein
MRSFSITLCLLSLSIVQALAQLPFTRTYGTPDALEEARGLCILTDGSVAVGGNSYLPDISKNVAHALRVDVDGDPLWIRDVNGFSDLFGHAICALPNGDVLMAGKDTEVPARGFGIMLASFHANGATGYTKKIAARLDASAVAVVPMPDNGAMLLATHEDGSGLLTSQLIRTDANGDTTWCRILDVWPGDESPRGLVALPDGYAICGMYSYAGNSDAFAIRTDAQGAPLWQQTYDVGPTDLASAIATDAADGLFLCGTTMGPTGTTPDVWVLHLLADGTLDWDMPIENDGTDLGLGIAAMADGGAVITGKATRPDGSGTRDLFLARISSVGDTLWKRHVNAGEGADATGYAVAMDATGIYAAGRALGTDGTDEVMLVRTTFDGSIVGIHLPTAGATWSVHPNPSQGVFRITGTHAFEGSPWRLIDGAGRTLMQGTVQVDRVIDCNGMAAGLYTLTVEGAAVRVFID